MLGQDLVTRVLRDGHDLVAVDRDAIDITDPASVAQIVRDVDVVVNTPASHGTRADGYAIRTATTSAGKTILTTVQAFAAAVQAIAAMRRGEEDVVSLQEYDAARLARRS